MRGYSDNQGVRQYHPGQVVQWSSDKGEDKADESVNQWLNINWERRGLKKALKTEFCATGKGSVIHTSCRRNVWTLSIHRIP